MKKFLALVLALMLCLSLAACGDKPASKSSEKPSNQPSNEPSNNSSNDAADQEDGFTALEVDEDARISDIEITGMKMGKEQYAVDEPITVTVTWKGKPAEDAWIGIIPADTPHGSEEKNDEYDVDYRYFSDMKSGDVFTFEYITLEPGEYTMRVNETDGGGAELAWCAFSVIGNGTDGSDVVLNGKGDTQNEDTASPVDEDGLLVSWGGVLKYNPDKWEKTNMGLKAKDSDTAFEFMPYGYTVDEMAQEISNNAEEITEEDITVNGNSAKKILYTSGWTPNNTNLVVIIDTAFIGSSTSRIFVIELSVAKGSAEEALLDDAEFWDMINSFYYDASLLN